MTDKDLALTILMDHFEKVGWPMHVNMQKLKDRAKVLPAEDIEGAQIVEIERHKPVLGMAYRKGIGMDAFEEYFMRYAVDVPNRSATELPERHGSYQFDAHGIVDTQLSSDYFSLSIESDDNDSYLIREAVCKDEVVVSSRDEAVEFVLSLGEPIEEQFSDSVDLELGESLESVREGLLSSHRQALNEALLAKAERLWEERDNAN
jgi:hypothetical protein